MKNKSLCAKSLCEYSKKKLGPNFSKNYLFRAKSLREKDIYLWTWYFRASQEQFSEALEDLLWMNSTVLLRRGFCCFVLTEHQKMQRKLIGINCHLLLRYKDITRVLTIAGKVNAFYHGSFPCKNRCLQFR